jgi:hypothetical protein
MRKIIVLPALSALLVAGLALPAAGAPPTFEREEINETFVDGELSEFCGFEVQAHVEGSAIFRAFERSGPGPESLLTLNLTVTLTAGDRSVKLKDVGSDMVRIEPDGTAVLTVVGQVPFSFNGALRIDLETGEVILEPQAANRGDAEGVCAALGA